MGILESFLVVKLGVKFQKADIIEPPSYSVSKVKEYLVLFIKLIVVIFVVGLNDCNILLWFFSW